MEKKKKIIIGVISIIIAIAAIALICVGVINLNKVNNAKELQTSYQEITDKYNALESKMVAYTEILNDDLINSYNESGDKIDEMKDEVSKEPGQIEESRINELKNECSDVKAKLVILEDAFAKVENVLSGNFTE